MGSAAAAFDWVGFVKEGGAYCSPLLLAGLIWLNVERTRLLDQLKERDAEVKSLAERVLTITAELKYFLFHQHRVP
jgi:hypothetical protein